MGKETASSFCAYKTGSLPSPTLPRGNRMSKEGHPYSFYSPLPVFLTLHQHTPSLSSTHHPPQSCRSNWWCLGGQASQGSWPVAVKEVILSLYGSRLKVHTSFKAVVLSVLVSTIKLISFRTTRESSSFLRYRTAAPCAPAGCQGKILFTRPG